MTSPSSPVVERTPLINPAQTVAGAAAAITSAVVGSYLGVAGTLIGAGVASVISSTAAALYGKSITAASTRVKQVAPARLPLAERLRRLPWKHVLLPAAVVFAIAVVLLTATEAVAGKPVSAVVTGQTTSGSTTLGELGGGTVGQPAPATPGEPAPASTETADPSATPTEGGDGEEQPTATPTGSSSESPSATGSPTGRPTDGPSGSPSSSAPARTREPSATPERTAPAPERTAPAPERTVAPVPEVPAAP